MIDTATADFIAAQTQLVVSTAKFPGYVCALMPLAFSRWLFAAVDWAGLLASGGQGVAGRRLPQLPDLGGTLFVDSLVDQVAAPW